MKICQNKTGCFLKSFRDKPGDKGFLSKLHTTRNPLCMKFTPLAHVRAFLMFFTSYQRKEVAQREDFISCKAELSSEHWTNLTEHKKVLPSKTQHFLQWRREQKTRKKKPRTLKKFLKSSNIPTCSRQKHGKHQEIL